MKHHWLRVRNAGVTVRSWLGRHWRVLALALVVIVIGLMRWFWPAPWDWMKGPGESNGSVLRNFALVAATAIGLPLAVWRSWVAHKQLDTAERGHNNERYQKGADMLGSDEMPTRMGGVYALERVAQEHPREYHVQIMKLLCAFLEHRAKDEGEEVEAESKEPRRDLEPAARAIVECRRRLAERGLLKEIEGDFFPKLGEANLSYANLSDADLSGADLSGANLSGADLARADLSGADLSRAGLSGAKLPGARLPGADLSRAGLWDANLSDAVLSRANLSIANLSDADLSLANLSDADLSDAHLSGANLSDADLSGANLSGANLSDADLSRADLSGAGLSGASIASTNFDQVKGLSQEELDNACQDQNDRPPRNLPDGLNWDEEEAIARWHDFHGP